MRPCNYLDEFFSKAAIFFVCAPLVVEKIGSEIRTRGCDVLRVYGMSGTTAWVCWPTRDAFPTKTGRPRFYTRKSALNQVRSPTQTCLYLCPVTAFAEAGTTVYADTPVLKV